MKFVGLCNRTIEYLFYALFLLVPLVFAGNTSELFEFSKMWVTFGIAVLIGFFWFSKMIVSKRLVFKRTVLDIPILLFLGSQIISSIITLDRHISLWGYYSRWNGGLISIITYIFLYYAFVSNFFNNTEQDNNKKGFFERTITGKTIVMRSLLVSLISGFIVVLWALPSHFGYDPTCLVFRGHLDVSCWTNDFQPKIRIFGSLGQPDWLAGYLGILLPLAAAFAINELRKTKKYLNPRLIFYTVSFMLFYVSVLYTSSRSGIGASLLSLAVFFIGYTFLNRKSLGFFKNKFVAGFIVLVLLLSFFARVQVPILDKFSFSEVQKILTKPSPLSPQTNTANQARAAVPTPAQVSSTELGGSNSFEIRKIVWSGAINVWKANPVFGTGVDTFAFAYYKFRPIEHNRVSEWNFLYNKAHNEYLNYLATTGAFGLLTYLSFIGLFILFLKVNMLNIKFKQLNFLRAGEKWDSKDPLILALATSFLSILLINFFGFSVVILNIYLLLIPAFALVLFDFIKHDKEQSLKINYISYFQWIGVIFFGVVGTVLILTLARFWLADTKYALGTNYNHAGQYQTAYPLLHEAVKLRNEPVFQDEMAVNDAIIAATLGTQGGTQSAALTQTLATESLGISQKLTQQYPNNVVFWKSRVRILYTLGNLDPSFMSLALVAIKQTSVLAPTDASILYNLGVLYGQNGDSKKAVEVLEKTVAYKPDYAEAHFALGVFYHELSVNKGGKIIETTYHQKALDQMTYILQKINPNFSTATQYYDTWSKEN